MNYRQLSYILQTFVLHYSTEDTGCFNMSRDQLNKVLSLKKRFQIYSICNNGRLLGSDLNTKDSFYGLLSNDTP